MVNNLTVIFYSKILYWCNSLFFVWTFNLFFLDVGFRLPSDVKKVFHPIICCAVSADLAALAFGYLSQSGLDPILGILKSISF
jgi:hypothetical protein